MPGADGTLRRAVGAGDLCLQVGRDFVCGCGGRRRTSTWTEHLVLTSYSDEAGAQEAKARDSVIERLDRVVSIEVSGG